MIFNCCSLLDMKDLLFLAMKYVLFLYNVSNCHNLSTNHISLLRPLNSFYVKKVCCFSQNNSSLIWGQFNIWGGVLLCSLRNGNWNKHTTSTTFLGPNKWNWNSIWVLWLNMSCFLYNVILNPFPNSVTGQGVCLRCQLRQLECYCRHEYPNKWSTIVQFLYWFINSWYCHVFWIENFFLNKHRNPERSDLPERVPREGMQEWLFCTAFEFT
jgi:hypothetical protein